MRWTIARGRWNGAEAAGYAALVNGIAAYESHTPMPEEWEFIIPQGILLEGLNTLVLSNLTTSATDAAYYTITSVTGEPLPNREPWFAGGSSVIPPLTDAPRFSAAIPCVNRN